MAGTTGDRTEREGTVSQTEDTEREILNWVSLEQTSITQALRTMAERNEEDAAEIEQDRTTAAAQVTRTLRDSAKSWRKKADELDALLEALPEGWEAYR